MVDPIRDLELTENEKKVLRQFMYLRYEEELMLMGAQEAADKTGLHRQSAHLVLKSLEDKELLRNLKRKGFMITEYGSKIINELIHRTKILEVFFHRELEMDLEKASGEANEISMFVSSELVDILCERMGNTVENVLSGGMPGGGHRPYRWVMRELGRYK